MILPASHTGGGDMSTMDWMSAACKWLTMLARLALNSCTGTCCLALQQSFHAGN